MSLASWAKKSEELLVLMKVQHFHDAMLMHIHKVKTNKFELTGNANEFLKNERKALGAIYNFFYIVANNLMCSYVCIVMLFIFCGPPYFLSSYYKSLIFIVRIR